MGLPSLLDAAIVAPAAILALLGLRLGFVRSLVAWPMRWLLPLIGAYAAGRLAELCVLVVWELASLERLVGPPVGWVAVAVAFPPALVALLMFMDNLIARVPAWTSGHPTGLGGRLGGGLAGMAVGLIVVAAAIELSPIRRGTIHEPAWVRESALLPHFRGALDGAESTLRSLWPYAVSALRWRL